MTVQAAADVKAWSVGPIMRRERDQRRLTSAATPSRMNQCGYVNSCESANSKLDPLKEVRDSQQRPVGIDAKIVAAEVGVGNVLVAVFEVQ